MKQGSYLERQNRSDKSAQYILLVTADNLEFLIAFFAVIIYNIYDQCNLIKLSALLLGGQTFNLSASLL